MWTTLLLIGSALSFGYGAWVLLPGSRPKVPVFLGLGASLRSWALASTSIGAQRAPSAPRIRWAWGAAVSLPALPLEPLRALAAGPMAGGAAGVRARALTLGATLLACSLTVFGIQAMQRLDPFPQGWDPPSLELATIFPNPQWVIAGSVLLLAGALLGSAVLPSVLAEIACPQPEERAAGTRHAFALAALAVSLAVPAYLYALTQAISHQAGGGAVLCLIGVIALAVLAVEALSPRRGMSLLWCPLLILEGLTVVALILGFVVLNAHDLRAWRFAWYGDEWPFFDAARGYLHGQQLDLFSQAGVYGIFPTLNTAYTAAVMRLFGADVFGWRMSSTLSAALPIVPLYWLGRQIGGRAVAVAVATFYATSDVLWSFSHIGYNNNEALLPMVAALAVFYAGMRSGRSASLLAAGAIAGAGWYTIYMSRLTIGILGLILLTEWAGGWRGG